jgi:uncharacterized membrane protein YadS
VKRTLQIAAVLAALQLYIVQEWVAVLALGLVLCGPAAVIGVAVAVRSRQARRRVRRGDNC